MNGVVQYDYENIESQQTAAELLMFKPRLLFWGPFFGKETEAFVASYSNSSGNVNKAINLEDRESNAFSKPCIARKSISAICLARILDPCVRLTEQRMSISTGL